MASPAGAGASEENCNNNDSFVNEIPMELEPKLTSTKNIIYRVPRKLRKLNEAAYTPDLISIGPFHHGKRELQAMEHHKNEYYERFVERIEKIHDDKRKEKIRDDLKKFIEDNCEEVHDSYATTTGKKDSKFIEIILIDACFIIELFLRNQELNDEQTSYEDYILRTAWLKKAMQLDLILLENQLPYFLLEKLYSISNLEISKRTGSSSSNTDSSEEKKWQFPRLAYRFFEDFCTDEAILDEMEEKKKEIKHFTDLVRQFRLPSETQEETSEQGENNVYSATEETSEQGGNCVYSATEETPEWEENYVYSATDLDKAGVAFVVNEKARLAEVKHSDPPCCFCYLRPELAAHFCFCCLRLELAVHELDDATELLFRNMIALEQCLYSDKAYISSYVGLMSQLIKTDQDADFLVEKGIIKNCSKHRVADLFTKLDNEIVDSDFYYATECRKLNQHHDKWLNRTMAKAKKVYFNDLWKGSSTVVGFFLLLFSISGSIKNIFLS